MIIEARNIMYSYKSKRDTLVLKQVSATFEEGIFYAIVGPSGSGKTTFLSLLAGLDSPVSGNILYNGEDIQKKGLNYHRRHDISLVFQNYNLIDYLTRSEEHTSELQSRIDLVCRLLLEKNNICQTGRE